MEYIYNGLSVNYEHSGNGNTIVLLHGWGTNLHTFDETIRNLNRKYHVYAIDLVGFGSSDEPEVPWSLSDYVQMLRSFINDLEITDPIILGHSFGGRIAIKYTALYRDVKKLILVDSAGIKHRLSIKVKLGVWMYKWKKKWYQKTQNVIKYNELVKNSGSSDYKNATNKMKGTLSKIVKEDLRKYLRTIDTETLLIWGKNDDVTPYSDALVMKKLLKNSGLVSFDDVGHFAYLEAKVFFNRVINHYLEVDSND